ncbi:Glucose-signaling factor 2 [Wickerhamomyces ciferrii]|uniref:Glucose-signaling factor 2 n=1 Tax=Wickerhamomyces ciferrii (strain ATCC 14091 / BCRC 22168 / CBS 111 / JCM 3599 / NBRC 0793 / NRRL Y-1031 F-60-10) TaxID=1206466 RepID=K0KW01_WICCF|nr:Glucose-signaling factor 2 [Wickerhamomyces ciferrii]CCH46157.1 Glucose-signaling factor 2 [Wickerhamomyces ciferrii]
MSDPADVLDAQDAVFEIYVRMNDDSEKDYCFNVTINDSFDKLLKIFDSLKISLRPSIFYNQRPIGFKISKSPGYLTDNGGLLFDNNADKLTQNVKLSDKISDYCWPGQLVLPIWEENYFLSYSIISLLLVWLYTDLPDFISPTPGICLTNQLSRFFANLAQHFNYDKLAQDLFAEIQPHQSTKLIQIFFFIIHIVKIAFLYFALSLGIFNPYTINPIKMRKIVAHDKLDEAKKLELIALGWTGTRRSTLDEYREFYKDFKIKQVGGIVKASKLGLFEKLREPGVFLDDGEGFQSDLNNTTSLKDLELDSSKFILNFDWFAIIGENYEYYLDNESKDKGQDVRNYRRYGPLISNERIEKIVQGRKDKGKELKKEK